MFALMCGCANLNVQQQASFKKISVEQRQVAQKRLTAWKVAGAFSIRQNNKQTIASYKWQQKSKNIFDLKIFGPLGVGVVSINSTADSAVLRRGNKIRTAATAADLLYDELGWNFPVQNLYFWARGLTVPGSSAHKEFDRFGHLLSVRQGLWLVKFTDYKTFSVGVDLPQRLLLSCSGVQIKLVFRNWQFAS
jgi:outer membrane lipoprotein LolB